MRYSHSATLVPPAQAEAQYDLTLDEEIKSYTEQYSETRVVWPQPATDGLIPQRDLSGNPEPRPNGFQTTR